MTQVLSPFSLVFAGKNEEIFISVAIKLTERVMRVVATALLLSSTCEVSAKTLSSVFRKSLLAAGVAEGVTELISHCDHPLTRLARSCDTFFQTEGVIEREARKWEKNFAGRLCSTALIIASSAISQKAISSTWETA
jgi:hypothetical protein